MSGDELQALIAETHAAWLAVRAAGDRAVGAGSSGIPSFKSDSARAEFLAAQAEFAKKELALRRAFEDLGTQ